jgi:hypothetical protein
MAFNQQNRQEALGSGFNLEATRSDDHPHPGEKTLSTFLWPSIVEFAEAYTEGWTSMMY